jgi:hypothetical protein
MKRLRGTNIIEVEGTLAIDAEEKDTSPESITIEDPALFTASLLADMLKQSGVHFDRRRMDIQAARGANTFCHPGRPSFAASAGNPEATE